MLEGILGIVRRLIGEDVRLLPDLAPGPLCVRVGAGQLEQVVFNLASNARDAMPDGGTFAISTRLVARDELGPGVEARGEGLAEQYVEMCFTDTGRGMEPHVAERAFEPFFTTKQPGHGTGLGLATVYGIVTRHGGFVTLDSASGRGTTVTVHMPATAEAVTAAEVAAPDPQDLIGRGETILVAEDEESVASLIVGALRQNGYQVLSAPNGKAARSAYMQAAADIDLVLTDVIMPGLSGPDLVLELHRVGHRPRVLFVSGYTDDALRRLERVEGAVDLLRKPFRIDALLRRVREALDRRG